MVTLLNLFSGCAAVLSSRYQKVSFQSTTPGAKIKVHSKGEVNNGQKVKIDKFRCYYTAEVKKDGYKTSNYSFQLSKRSPTIAFTVLNLAIPFYGWFFGIPLDFGSYKTMKYDNVQLIPALMPYDKRREDEKYMLINNTSIDAKGTDIIWHTYKSIYKFNDGNNNDSKKTRKGNKSKDREDIKVDNTIFTDALNETMKNMNFIDTSNSVFPNVNNSLYLNGKIKKITFHSVNPYLGTIANSLISMELKIEWEVLNYYKEKVYTVNTQKKSDLFLIDNDGTMKDVHAMILKAVEDNLNYSVIDLRKELSNKGVLKITDTKQEALPVISLAKPIVPADSRMNDYLKSGVTIKVDDGHGSGIIVSEDGYIVTAYHVVANSKKIEIIFNDGTKAEAQLIRKNGNSDLALLKVNNTNLRPLVLSQNSDVEIGIDVWAIGTPKSVELGQSVSKGILSGIRNANNVKHLQTDVSINGGNSGGGLVSKDGTVLGIVTSKLVGVGTEGVGFAISADEIFKGLYLEYK